MRRLWRRFWALDFLIKLIWVFCFFGFLFNLVYVIYDLRHDGLLLRLHLGFLILYLGQTVFILLKERMVCVLSLLQAVIALVTNIDFTFVPLLRAIGQVVYWLTGPFSLEDMQVYKYVFTSACLTLELLKTYLLFALLPAPKKKKPLTPPASAEEN